MTVENLLGLGILAMIGLISYKGLPLCMKIYVDNNRLIELRKRRIVRIRELKRGLKNGTGRSL